MNKTFKTELVSIVVDKNGKDKIYILRDNFWGLLVSVKVNELRNFLTKNFENFDSDSNTEFTKNVIVKENEVIIDNEDTKKISLWVYKRLYRDYGSKFGFENDNKYYEAFVNDNEDEEGGLPNSDIVVTEIKKYVPRTEALTKKNTRVSRKKTTQIINEIVEIAKEINEDKESLYKVDLLGVFGSYVNSDKDVLGDVDIFYTISLKQGITQKELLKTNKELMTENDCRTIGGKLNAQSFKTYELTLKRLKNRHTSVSLHDYETDKDIIYSDKYSIFLI